MRRAILSVRRLRLALQTNNPITLSNGSLTQSGNAITGSATGNTATNVAELAGTMNLAGATTTQVNASVAATGPTNTLQADFGIANLQSQVNSVAGQTSVTSNTIETVARTSADRRSAEPPTASTRRQRTTAFPIPLRFRALVPMPPRSTAFWVSTACRPRPDRL